MNEKAASTTPASTPRRTPSPEMSPGPKYNNIFLHLGDWGLWQKMVFFLVSAPVIFCAIHTYLNSFTAAVADHRCLIPGVDNVTDRSRNYYEPTEDLEKMAALQRLVPRTKDGKFEQCVRYYENASTANSSAVLGPCSDGWVFSHDTFGSTVIERLQLVCDRSDRRKYVDVSTMVGMLIGAITFGQLSDSFGRQKTMMVALILQAIVAIGTAYTPTYGGYLVFRCMVGAFLSGVFNTAFCLAMECVGPSQRTWVGIGVEIFWALGTMILAGFAYLLPNFSDLQLAMSVPLLLFIPYFWIVPESPRWLLLHGFYDRFRKVMINAARMNRIRLPDKVLDEYMPPGSAPSTPSPSEGWVEVFEPTKVNDAADEAAERLDRSGDADSTVHQSKSKDSSFDRSLLLPPKQKGLTYFFTRPMLLLKTANVLFNWFVNTLVYYGLTMNSTNLNDNAHLSLCISGAVEIPAYVFCILVLNRFGRKPNLVLVLLLCGVTLFTSIWIPPTSTVVLTVLSMVGKCAISASFAIIYVFSAELFPTVARNAAMGLCAMFARFGGIVAPVIADLGSEDAEGHQDPTYPLAIFGFFALTAGVFALFLPETMDKMLPETVEDFEEDGLVNPFAACNQFVRVRNNACAPCCLNGDDRRGDEEQAFRGDGIKKYEPNMAPHEDSACLEYVESLKPEATYRTEESNARPRRHTISRSISSPRGGRHDEATINRGNAMLQAAVSMTFSVHSFHNSDVEVYPVHPRVVETSFRDRAASVASEFRVRVNSVTATRNDARMDGRKRAATINVALGAEDKKQAEAARRVRGGGSGSGGSGRSNSLFSSRRTEDLRKGSVVEIEEESSVTNLDEEVEEGQNFCNSHKKSKFYLKESNESLREEQ